MSERLGGVIISTTTALAGIVTGLMWQSTNPSAGWLILALFATFRRATVPRARNSEIALAPCRQPST